MIGWYIHHVGKGHLTRALSVRPYVDADVVALSSLARSDDSAFTEWVSLARDDTGDTFVAPTAGGRLHWVPVGHSGLQARMNQISTWITVHRPQAVVVDVSVEVAALARLFGVPVVVFVGPGHRDDEAHRLAFGLADRIIAPWTREIYDPPFLHPFAAKTSYVGAISRFDGRTATETPNERDVVVLTGAGGLDISSAHLEAAAAAHSSLRWTGLGVGAHGWATDVWSKISSAGVVISHAGQNALAEVAAARRPTVVIAQDRPFDEQREVATALRRADIAECVLSWPNPEEWPQVLQRARDRGGSGWARWSWGDGARRAAEVINSVASGAP